MMPDEEVFLFLTGTGQVAETYGVVGYSQGKFTIVQGEDGQKMISRDASNPGLKIEGKSIKRGAKTIPLADFKNQIEDYLRR